MRIDKWLWAARFFKTRSIAAQACALGRIRSGSMPVKPAREIHAGEFFHIKNDSGDFEVEVLGLSEIRGPAAVAQTLYRETEESRAARIKLVEDRKAMPKFEFPEGRPTKKNRRELRRLRGR